MTNPIRAGYGTLHACLNLQGAEKAIDFVKLAFGAEELERFAAPDGTLMHAALRLGDSTLAFSEAVREPAMPTQLGLYVQDCDEVLARAVAAGAKQIFPLQDMFWGDRVGRVEDPWGNRWTIATHKEDVSPAEMQRRGEAFARELMERNR